MGLHAAPTPENIRRALRAQGRLRRYILEDYVYGVRMYPKRIEKEYSSASNAE